MTAPAGDEIVIECPPRRLRLKQLDAGVHGALLRLSQQPQTKDELVTTAHDAHAATRVDRLDQELDRLAGRGLLAAVCSAEGRILLEAHATGAPARFAPAPRALEGRFQLSRFAYAHRRGPTLVVDSPVHFIQTAVLDPRLGTLLAALCRPQVLSDLHEHADGLSETVVADCVSFLQSVGAVDVEDEAGVLAEDRDEGLAQRQLHDLIQHAESRIGLTDRPTAATFSFAGRIKPTPAVRAGVAAKRVPLPRPDLDGLLVRDITLTQAMEWRRSTRRFGSQPLAASALGEFLFRVARVRDITQADDGNPDHAYDITNRPYPCGGAAYDIDLYLVARAVDGVAPGFYRYHPVDHALDLVSRDRAGISAIERAAQFATRRPDLPQVLVILASRFARMSWKYEGIAYASTLKHAGVLYEAMYLTATSMGLAACGLGCGNSAAFNRLTGEAPHVESSVGEFMLGTLPSGEGSRRG